MDSAMTTLTQFQKLKSDSSDLVVERKILSLDLGAVYQVITKST